MAWSMRSSSDRICRRLPPAHVAAAFTHLGSGRDLVLGPSEDGGYYLIGMHRGTREHDLFTDIEWGTADVLVETLLKADDAGLSAVLVEPWYDVDTPVDLDRVAADARPEAARHTRQWIRAFHT